MRSRRSRNQKPRPLPPASITGEVVTRSTLPNRCGDPGPHPAAQSMRRRAGVRALLEEPVHGRAGAAHVGSKRTGDPEPSGERCRSGGFGEIVRRQGGEVRRTPRPAQRLPKLVLPTLEVRAASKLVEAPVDHSGRAFLDLAGERDDDPEVLRELERREALARAFGELRPRLKEEGNVRAQLGPERLELLRSERFRERGVCEAEGGRRVGASAPEACGDWNLLPDSDAPYRLDAGRPGEPDERSADDRVARESLDRQSVTWGQLDPVADVDSLEDRGDLVQPIDAPRPDHEREIDLCRGNCSALLHPARASASCTNSSGASSSARTLACRPSAASASWARSRSAKPLRSSEFASVLRRCANAAETTRRAASSSESHGRVRPKATSAESTLGGGRKQVRATGWRPVRSTVSCSTTETAPYSFVPGGAKKRSATSRWTITHQTLTDGNLLRLSMTTGVATLYGRFATSLVGGGSNPALRRSSASPNTSSTLSRAPRRFRSIGSRLWSSSTA